MTSLIDFSAAEQSEITKVMPDNDQSYQLLFDSNPHAMWVYDLETLRFLAVNNAAIHHYGYLREEFLERTIKDIRPPEDIPWLLERVSQVTTGLGSVEARHRKKDGTTIDVEVVSHTLIFAGRRAELVLSMDITERKRAQEEHLQFIREQAARAEAEEAQRRLRFLWEAGNLLSGSLEYEITLKNVARLAVPELADYCLIDIIDEDKAIRRVEVASGDPRMSELGSQLQKYPPNLSNPEAPVMRTMRSGKLMFYPDISDALLVATAHDEEHLRILRALGSKSLAVAPLVARGRTLGAITFSLAESDRSYSPSDLLLIEEVAARAALAVDNARLYEQAQRANRAKDEFLATVSHELRTPLSSMLVWARMLAAGKLDKQTSSSAMESLVSNIKSLSQLINDLLDVSRITTGKLSIDTRPIKLIPIIEAAINVVRPAADAKKIVIETKLDPGAKPVLGDPDRLQQVLWNLLTNAIKFSPAEGHVEIKVEETASDARITVSDLGQGISANLLPYVFDPFRQADSSDSREHGGLGLGLAIVRELVEMHGGTIEADSAGEGQGCTFTVKLPLLTLATEEQDVQNKYPRLTRNIKMESAGRNV
ncbi:MAG TPA: ATP-binding protein [Pyrinomonadaceae bacterium]